MDEIEEKKENVLSHIKLYSSRAISGATFFGGPLAAGYMISENYKSLDRPIEARNSLIVGILSTIILFVGIFTIPETIIEKIPNQIIPLIYTGIIYFIVEWKLGDILRLHKENENLFFSGWRAAGIGFISLIIILIGVFSYLFFGTNNEIYNQYDKSFEVFSKNETETLVFYDHLNTQSSKALIEELEDTIIPKWKENIQIINETNKIEGLPLELIEQNKLLLKYSELRLEVFKLFKKAIKEDTDIYVLQLNKKHREIDVVIEKLNQ